MPTYPSIITIGAFSIVALGAASACDQESDLLPTGSVSSSATTGSSTGGSDATGSSTGGSDSTGSSTGGSDSTGSSTGGNSAGSGGDGGTAAAGGGGSGQFGSPAPEFNLANQNSSSSPGGAMISLSQFNGQVSAWFFGHST